MNQSHHTMTYMTQKLTLLFMLAFCTLCSCSQNTADRNDWYELSWYDDFNGKKLNDSIWSKMKRMPTGRSLCNLTPDERMYEVRKGRLRLYARYNNGILPNDTATFLTGGVTSEGKRSFTYGKIEARLRIKGARGTWPAVWLMPVDYKHWQYPHRAEIDILEYTHRNNFVYQTVHTHYTDSLRQTDNPPRQAKPLIKYEKYNVYALEILPTELIFSINGKETFRYPKLKDAPEGQYPFGVESYLMIDMQIGGNWVGYSIDTAQFPVYIDIDWVKFYELKK